MERTCEIKRLVELSSSYKPPMTSGNMVGRMPKNPGKSIREYYLQIHLHFGDTIRIQVDRKTHESYKFCKRIDLPERNS